MSNLSLEAVRFHYDSPYACVFEQLDLQLDTSWRIGLVGRNGRGKSTLLKLLHGELVPTRGRIDVGVPTRVFPRTPARTDVSTREVVRESIAPFSRWEAEMSQLGDAGDAESLDRYGDLALLYEDEGGYVIDQKIEQEWAAMRLDPELLGRSFDTLSGGEQTRALILTLFLHRVGFALIDEPTNHLDAGGRDLVARYLARKPGFILASHDRAVLDHCVDHIVSIEPDEIKLVASDFSGYRTQRSREENFETRERDRLKREIRTLEDVARSRRDWSNKRENEKLGAADRGFVGHRAAKQMKRALHVEQRADQKLSERRALIKIPEKNRSLKLERSGRPGQSALDAVGITIRVGDRTLLRDLSVRVRHGDRVAIEGVNGCGKTMLLDVLAGARSPDSGVVHRSGGLRVGRAHQTPIWQHGTLADRVREANLDTPLFRQILGVMGMEGDVFDRPIETFSAGERRKAELTRSFVSPVDLLIWDEPLNHLDIPSREQIETVLLEYTPTMIFVEHDRQFIERIATSRIQL